MSKQSDRVKRWRKVTKERIIVAMGGSCCICGYNKCQTSLALHHLDPSQKDFNFSSVRANPKSWESIVKELRKCVLVCHNCHCEIHEGLVMVPDNAPVFNEDFLKYKKIKEDLVEELSPCPICKELKQPNLKYCSLSCSGKSKSKVDWNSVNLEEELLTKSVVKIAEELRCSDAAVHKRLKKLGLK